MSNSIRVSAHNPAIELAEPPSAVRECTRCQAPPFNQFSRLDLNTESGDLTVASICVRLDLEDLTCFSVVERQYESWGVLFQNAIAIRPSNPAFSPQAGLMLLLGAPESGCIEATFLRPVQYVSSFIISSRRTVMSAFNRHNQLIGQTESQANSRWGRCLNQRLSLSGSNIHKVTLCSFNGELTIDEFCFCAA
ncbi:MAG: hypothetical protein EDM05_007410 [Leptolyngbya sp. IPPAS B-1204]|uniref:Uncharacterized protein n=1 Tax=Leptolyngbya sp. NK1-12 TaxID=2547451 RepID=A0AA96WP00_9CYAN|nr:hypothetical protein [Leptolyngbya sp. NK1-12]MBF2050252.1 hypothetical protein [Elainella sp. C42_A2020_010]RNJ65787.1 MAG: hypothetical protein EDM05_29475 [Leptolyngbya sp. IPPAS B-1204]WNZ25586.1 hypothetical protein HJG54_23935 [Leptolyngbya sp. NK1-12]